MINFLLVGKSSPEIVFMIEYLWIEVDSEKKGFRTSGPATLELDEIPRLPTQSVAIHELQLLELALVLAKLDLDDTRQVGCRIFLSREAMELFDIHAELTDQERENVEQVKKMTKFYADAAILERDRDGDFETKSIYIPWGKYARSL